MTPINISDSASNIGPISASAHKNKFRQATLNLATPQRQQGLSDEQQGVRVSSEDVSNAVYAVKAPHALVA